MTARRESGPHCCVGYGEGTLAGDARAAPEAAAPDKGAGQAAKFADDSEIPF